MWTQNGLPLPPIPLPPLPRVIDFEHLLEPKSDPPSDGINQNQTITDVISLEDGGVTFSLARTSTCTSLTGTRQFPLRDVEEKDSAAPRLEATTTALTISFVI